MGTTWADARTTEPLPRPVAVALTVAALVLMFLLAVTHEPGADTPTTSPDLMVDWDTARPDDRSTP